MSNSLRDSRLRKKSIREGARLHYGVNVIWDKNKKNLIFKQKIN